MTNYIQILISFAAIMIIRFLLHFSKFMFLRKVLNKQDILIDGLSESASEKEKSDAVAATDWIEENQIEIKQVVLKTGLHDPKKSYMEPLGLNYAHKQSVSSLDNLTLLNAEIMGRGRQILIRAKGYYKNQALKSFNPIFWIEFLIFLPREIFKYISINENAKFGSIIIKVIQVIYWVVSLIVMYIRFIK